MSVRRGFALVLIIIIILIIFFIFFIPVPSYIGKTACAPCAEKNNCPPCPSGWVWNKPLFWMLIFPLFPQNQTGKTTAVKQAEITPTPDVTANPDSIGANWKTYTSQALGFSIKYPNNLSFIKETTTYTAYENVSFSEKDLTGIYGIVDTGPGLIVSKGSVLKEGYDTVLKQEINKAQPIQQGSRDQSGQLKLTQIGEDTRLPNKSMNGVDILIHIRNNSQGYTAEALMYRNNDYWQIALTGNTNSTTEEISNYFDQILSTFKFLN